MASRHKRIDYLLGRRFPAYLESVRDVLKEEIRNHKGASDTSDVVVDAVRRRVDLDPNDLWPDEARRVAAEEALKAEFGSKPSELRERERWRRFIVETRSYEADLLDASDDDLLIWYNGAKAEEQAEIEADAATKERWAFFNEPHAMADYDYWLEMPTWTVDEAVSLSFGKEPRVVTRSALRPELGIRKSPFAFSFERRWQHVTRAVCAGDLNDPLKPKDFILWCQQNRISIPASLDQPARVDEDRNWKDLYGRMRQEHDELLSRYAQQEAELNSLRANVDELNPKARNNLYRLVLGMAILRFEYRTDIRSGVPKMIASELEAIGIQLKDDAVRSWLTTAADELDLEWKDPIKWTGVKRDLKPKSG